MENIYLFTKIKISNKIGSFRFQDWLFTCDEQVCTSYIVKVKVYENVPSEIISNYSAVHGWALFFDEKNLAWITVAIINPFQWFLLDPCSDGLIFVVRELLTKQALNTTLHQTQKECMVVHSKQQKLIVLLSLNFVHKVVSVTIWCRKCIIQIWLNYLLRT